MKQAFLFLSSVIGFLLIAEVSLSQSIIEINDNDVLESVDEIYDSDIDNCPSNHDCFGKYMPANGIIRVLLVFIRFEDDLTEMSNWNSWPDPNDIFNVEDWMSNMIDSDILTNSNNYLNLTNYLRVASDNSFHVVGEAVYVKAPPRSSYSSTGYSLSQAVNKDVLLYLDPYIDFSDYDNWTGSVHLHENEPDSTIDMVYMIYRNPNQSEWFISGAGGFVPLGFNLTLPSGMKIDGSLAGGNGSGLTIELKDDFKKRFDDSFVHELAHYLLGGIGNSHPYTSNSQNRKSY